MKKLAILATTAFCALAISTASAQTTKKDSSVKNGNKPATTTKNQVESTRPATPRSGTTTDGARDTRPNGSTTNGTGTQPTEPNNNGSNTNRTQPGTTPGTRPSGSGSNGSSGTGNGSNGSTGSGNGSSTTPATPPRR